MACTGVYVRGVCKWRFVVNFALHFTVTLLLRERGTSSNPGGALGWLTPRLKCQLSALVSGLDVLRIWLISTLQGRVGE